MNPDCKRRPISVALPNTIKNSFDSHPPEKGVVALNSAQLEREKLH